MSSISNRYSGTCVKELNYFSFSQLQMESTGTLEPVQHLLHHVCAGGPVPWTPVTGDRSTTAESPWECEAIELWRKLGRKRSVI